ncbi:MAG: hypothetical protein ACI4V2_08005 [Alloprevotella sp.]
MPGTNLAFGLTTKVQKSFRAARRDCEKAARGTPISFVFFRPGPKGYLGVKKKRETAVKAVFFGFQWLTAILTVFSGLMTGTPEPMPREFSSLPPTIFRIAQVALSLIIFIANDLRKTQRDPARV